MNNDWIKELNLDKLIEFPHDAIMKVTGREIFIKLHESFAGSNYYFSEKVIEKLKKEYIRLHPEMTAKELSYKIRTTEQNVYNVRKGTGDSDNLDLFEENN